LYLSAQVKNDVLTFKKVCYKNYLKINWVASEHQAPRQFGDTCRAIPTHKLRAIKTAEFQCIVHFNVK